MGARPLDEKPTPLPNPPLHSEGTEHDVAIVVRAACVVAKRKGRDSRRAPFVVPVKWIPACAGMTPWQRRSRYARARHGVT